MTLHFLNDVAYDAESTQTSKLRHNRLFEECSTRGKLINRIPGARFTNVLSVKKFVSSFLRTVCVSQTPSTYEFLKDFAKIFLNIVVTLRQGGGDLIFQKIS